MNTSVKMSIEQKKCNICERIRPIIDFTKNKTTKSGYGLGCKACDRKRCAIYREDNKEKCKEAGRKWRINNPEKCKVKDHEAARKRIKAWRLRNPEKAKAQIIQWRKDNKERYYAHSREWQAKNPEKIREMGRNRDAKERLAEGKHTAEQINKLFQLQKGVCAYCHIDLNKQYHADHIYPISKGGDNYIYNIQLLCPTCNLRKHAKNPIEYRQKEGFLF